MTGFNVEDVFSLAAKELYFAKKEADAGPGSSGSSTGGATLNPSTKKGQKEGGCC